MNRELENDLRRTFGHVGGTPVDALVIRVRQFFCRHEFRLDDLSRAGIIGPEKPTSRDCKEWEQYLDELWYGDWRTYVVRWPCRKCGKVFEAFCGLDITPKYGSIVA